MHEVFRIQSVVTRIGVRLQITAVVLQELLWPGVLVVGRVVVDHVGMIGIAPIVPDVSLPDLAAARFLN